MKIYLASPFGFSESTRFFMHDLFLPHIATIVESVANPWDLDENLENRLNSATLVRDYENRRKELLEVDREIAVRNERQIRDCDLVLAVLDGQEIDSGVAAEVGFAYALGKKIL